MTRVVRIGNITVGEGRQVIIAGPCSVEPAFAYLADQTKAAGADILRGFVYKHRTSPRSFQGLGDAGMALVEEARGKTGLPVVIEALAPGQIGPLSEVADAIQIGSRNMHNVELLRALGRTRSPVILKRGLSATYEEWLGAAEYIEEGGNHGVILCERGIRTFETTTRNTLDLSALVYLRTVSDYPIIVDPSHAAGRRDLVPGLAEVALATGADGLEVEAHANPDAAMSDAPQTIGLEVLARICQARDRQWALSGEGNPSSLDEARQLITILDSTLIELVEKRLHLARECLGMKLEARASVVDPTREREVVKHWLMNSQLLRPQDSTRIVNTLISITRQYEKRELEELLDRATAAGPRVALDHSGEGNEK